MRYTNESHKQWIVRMLQEIEVTLSNEEPEQACNSYKNLERMSHISAINYAIGYLIGIGWCDNE